MQTVAIVGVGLIGGSFALALREAGFAGRMLGVSSPRTLEAALRLGVVNEGCTLEQAAAAADLIYLAQPICGILDTLDRLATLVRPGTLVTDAGSTKSAIVARAAKLPPNTFLGGHPMAGKEQRGVEAAEAGLFAGRPYVLTPRDGVLPDTPLTRDFLNFLRLIGTVPVVLRPEEHDRTVALVSHLPQLASTALAAAISEEFGDATRNLPVGPGVADMTRLALSSFDLWGDILQTNAGAIDHALGVYIDKLTVFRQNLATPALREEFAVAARSAAALRGRK